MQSGTGQRSFQKHLDQCTLHEQLLHVFFEDVRHGCGCHLRFVTIPDAVCRNGICMPTKALLGASDFFWDILVPFSAGAGLATRRH